MPFIADGINIRFGFKFDMILHAVRIWKSRAKSIEEKNTSNKISLQV